MIEQLQQGILPVTPGEIKAIWWTLSYVILPALAGGYLFTLGAGKFLHAAFVKRFDNLRDNDLAHMKKRILELEKK